MKLTQKLLSYLHRAFSKDPVQFLALRLRYDGGMTWKIEDAVLTTTVTAGTGEALQVDLGQYSIAELADFLRDQPGYTVEFEVLTEASTLSARILLDGSNDQDKSNGDHLYAYTSLTWAYLEANAFELKAAREQIYQMLRQMSAPTGEGEWLDEIGDYYNVRRRNGEIDSLYGPRIVQEVSRPRNNNKAIELAISQSTGGLPSKVIDVTLTGDLYPLHDGAISYDGAEVYNPTGKAVRNLFDVEYAFDLLGSEAIAPFQARVLALIDQFRSAGTHLRQILLAGGEIVDDVMLDPSDSAYLVIDLALIETIAAQTEVFAVAGDLALIDTAAQTVDGDLGLNSLSVHTYNGVHDHGGTGRVVKYDSGLTVTETL